MLNARRQQAHEALIATGAITFPDELPITAWRDELRAAIDAHQVVVVAGETGSGKSTQLPKLCLELGRGVDGMIGHTQPRRVAARTIAARIADELGTELGDVVGYSIRFNDRIGERTLVKVMTDGILLAELQRDRQLRRYDTLIIDEAHERSLNIDFLLGYLRRLLERRKDLKVIVTSATIDTARFAEHFAAGGATVPVVEVTGRTYPVEVRYRPFGVDPDDERDQVQAVLDAVDELAREGPGDVLAFFSGEREIHDTADALREHLRPGDEVLPLYARLSSVEQQRIFAPHRGRRVVLATNVAETSITVPGVRYVIDTGVARISRYSRRLKVQRLPIEDISQASAAQRAGRCGRLGPGVCIRLYDEDDHVDRPAFTEPEILRTNLASVILQMTAIGLGDVAAFPFVEPPDAASIRDGYALLEELAAVRPADPDGTRRLTKIGTQLARLPVDPRLGRMVLAAQRHDCVREVLVIAAALSIQDPRERPAEHREVANELHRRFVVDGSDLLGLVALWDYLRTEQRARSGNQFRKLCRTEYLNYLRVREWQDLFSQLRQVAGQLGIRPGTDDSHPDHVHRALLTGLLSHVGMREDDGREFRGARGARFVIGRDSSLSRRSGRWVMAAELVETNRLWAHRVADIQPQWAEDAGAHLVTRSYGEARWDARRGTAVTTETVMLYGLAVVAGRTVGLGRIDPELARELFIRHALVEGDWTTHHAFVEHNAAFVARVRSMEDRVRRRDLLDDEALARFYDERVGAGAVSTVDFDKWWKDARTADPQLLDLSDDVLLADADHPAVRLDGFPDTWRQGDVELALRYRFDLGAPDDGVTVLVPITVLNQVTVDGFDWHIAGHRGELVASMVRTLPKSTRRALIPAAETIAAATARLGEPNGRFVDAVAAALSDVSGVQIPPSAISTDDLAAHLRIHFAVVDEAGKVLARGDDLAELQRAQSGRARAAIADAAPLAERHGITAWDMGEIPAVVEFSSAGNPVRAYPVLVDDGDSVSLRLVTNPDLQRRAMRGGVRRLVLSTVAPSRRAVRSVLTDQHRMIVARAGMVLDELVADAIDAAADDLVSSHDLPWDTPAFDTLVGEARGRLGDVASRALLDAVEVLAVAVRVRATLDTRRGEAVAASVADARSHLDRLVRPGFVVTAGVARLRDVARYMTAIELRLERLGDDIARDRRRMDEVVPLERAYAEYLHRVGRRAPREATTIGWQLEELRVAVFAQQLGVVGGKVSVTRLERALAELASR